MAMSTTTNAHLIRSNLWSSQLKTVLEDDLLGLKYVDWVSEFPDGDTLNIPSIGRPEVQDYAEGQAVRYTSIDTGNWTLTVTDYKSSGIYVTNKMKQDSYVMNQVVASFVPGMRRAINEVMEQDMLAIGPNGQTAANSNTINSAKHRFIGSGTAETIAVEDFAKAAYALQKANVPLTNLVGIIDPSVAYQLGTQTNIVNLLTPNMQWGRIVNEGFTTGTRFIGNVYGFDLYVCHNLKVNTASEAIDGVTAAAGVNNIFFSAAPGVSPFKGVMRQEPRVDSEYNKDLQRDEYVTTVRYGFGFFRPENFVNIITDTDQVYA